jgi:hypothetical protein
MVATSSQSTSGPASVKVTKPTKKQRQRANKKKGETGDASSVDDEFSAAPMDECEEARSSSGSEAAPPSKLCKKEGGAPAPTPALADPPPNAPIDVPPSAAPATPTAEPSMLQILAAINNMSFNVGKRFDSVDTRLDGNDRRYDEISNEFKNFKVEVDAKFAAINAPAAAGSGAAPRRPAPPWAAPVAGSPPTSSYYTSAAAPPAQKTPPWAAPAQSSSDEFGRKVFAMGFPRKLPRLALMAFWDEVKAKMPTHLVLEAKFTGGPAKHFGVVFPSRDAARLFTTTVSDISRTTECRWVSPREGEGSSAISFRVERTIAERDRGRVLSKAWSLISPLVKTTNAWKAGMKLTTDSARGTIAVVSAMGADMWELVELKADGDGYAVLAFEANLAHFGVGPATAEAIRASSTKPLAAAAAVAAAPAAGDIDL